MASASYRFWGWAGVPLAQHLYCTTLIAERLYSRDWRYLIERLGLEELRDALRLSTLLHDAGKALHRGPTSFPCHELEGALLLASTARLLRGPEAALYSLAALAAYLHHHGMGSDRYSWCARRVSARETMARWRSLCRPLLEHIRSAARAWGLETLVEKMCIGAEKTRKPPGPIIETTLRLLQDQLSEKSFEVQEAVASRLASTLVGFTSVSDTLAAMLEGREGEPRQITCSRPSRYAVRVVCEIVGWDEREAKRLIEEMLDECQHPKHQQR